MLSNSPIADIAFTFDESTHTYRVNNRIVPGCTRVLDRGGLVDYSMVPEYVLQRKSDLGKAVHAATHYFDDGELDWDSVAEECKPRVDAWVDFRQKTGFVPRRREFKFVSELNGMLYGVTIDAEGMLGREEAVVEIKTCAQILPHHPVQLAGQMAGLPHEKFNTPLARFFRRTGYVVLLQPNGKAKLSQPYRERKDFDRFASALSATWAKMDETPQLDMEEL